MPPLPNSASNDAAGQPPAPPRGIVVLLATGGGVGLIAPFAPGTFGSLWGVLLAWSLAQLPSGWLALAALAAFNLVGVPLCSAAQRRLGKKDPGEVVWDEIGAVPIAMLGFSPAEVAQPAVLLGGFLTFRLFDILKPPPVRQVELLPRGLGVMADDWMAALYALIAMHAIRVLGGFAWLAV